MTKQEGFKIQIGVHNGAPVEIDIEQNTNILIAGTTGSGKSYMVNKLISKIADQRTPEEAKFILFDIKGDNEISKLPHILCNLDNNTSTKKYVECLKEIITEMNSRKSLLVNAGVSTWVEFINLNSDNDQYTEKLHWKFIVVEELYATLELLGKDKEEFIQLLREIEKQGRPLGIRVILVSQIITGEQLPEALISECGVKIILKINEQTIKALGIDTRNLKVPNKHGEAIFKEEYLTEPIFINTLG